MAWSGPHVRGLPTGRQRSAIGCCGPRPAPTLLVWLLHVAAAMMAGGLLCEWLGELAFDDFQRDHLGRAPVARASSVARPGALLDDEILAAVLAGRDVDGLVVARGRLLDVPLPTCAGELATYLRGGIGLCLRHAERHHHVLADVAKALASAFAPSTAQVQLFITARDTYGFAWHYDDEDVFIVQTAGVKDYYFRDNTVARGDRAHSSRFGRFASETSPIMTARLVPGDFLYLPARWWHMAQCIETSFSVSVGVLR